MEARTAEQMLTAYVDAIDRVHRAERLIQRTKQEYEEQLRMLEVQLSKEKEERDNLHAFARSAINALTPARGFTV
jgi:hypothetical protein